MNGLKRFASVVKKFGEPILFLVCATAVWYAATVLASFLMFLAALKFY